VNKVNFPFVAFDMRELSEEIRVKHILNRFGMGASEDDIAYYGKGGWKSAVERLVNDSRPEVDVNIPDSFYDATLPGLRRMSQLQGHWYRRLIITNRPLQHKMMLFWHDHFATGSSKVRQAQVMLAHMDRLYDHSLGSFRELIGAVSKDPAMLIWLDNQDNKKNSPNENFAREVMELFTLGVDNGYTEEDIREVARAFTGWTFETGRGRQSRDVRFLFDRNNHDSGHKKILGSEGSFDGDDVLDILCMQPRTSIHLVWKIWEHFVFDNPPKSLIERLATGFRKNNLSIKWLVKEIMLTDEFYSERAIGKKIKNPVEFCVTSARQIGVQKLELADSPRPPAFGSLLKVATSEMGMELLEPPDVSGWPSGIGWISASTMLKRTNWANLLFLGEEVSLTRNRRQAPPFTARNFFTAKTPSELAVEMVSKFCVTLSESQIQVVIDAANRAANYRLTNSNFNQVAASAGVVIFSTPEFQMH